VTELVRESRSAALVDAEFRGMNMRGYAAVFDVPWNEELTKETGYVEMVARGTFRKALAARENVPLLWQHDRRDVLATTAGQTLRLREDGKGLLVEAKLPRSPFGEHVRELIERGDVQGMSYGILTAPTDSDVTVRGGVYYRTIKNAQKIIDTTLTWEPAYNATSVELRTLAFAALPLQALVPGLEEQRDNDAVTDPPDDPAGSWWGDEVNPSETATNGHVAATRRRAWEVVVDELERGHGGDAG
jgi:uncharacterized protein